MENKPQIIINENITDNNFILHLAKMMNVNSDDDVIEFLGVLFSKLGFTINDNIVISKVVKNSYDAVRLEFQVNGDSILKTLFHRRYGRNCLGLALTDSNKNHYMYKCDISKSNDGFNIKMLLKGSEIGQGKDLVICKKDYNNFSYSFFSPISESGFVKQVITLNVLCSDEEKTINKAKKEYLSPKNEKSLIAYLSNCSYPVDLRKIFEDIRALSFDGDLTSIPYFDIRVLTIFKLNHGDERFDTDHILLRNGKLQRISFSHIGQLRDCSTNFGGSVEFVPGGLAYWMLYPNGRWEMLGFIDNINNDERVSKNLVDESASEIIRLFPNDAERILIGIYDNEILKSSLESGFINRKTKQNLEMNAPTLTKKPTISKK